MDRCPAVFARASRGLVVAGPLRTAIALGVLAWSATSAAETAMSSAAPGDRSTLVAHASLDFRVTVQPAIRFDAAALAPLPALSSPIARRGSAPLVRVTDQAAGGTSKRVTLAEP
jgi:hypothetical protein